MKDFTPVPRSKSLHLDTHQYSVWVRNPKNPFNNWFMSLGTDSLKTATGHADYKSKDGLEVTITDNRK